MRQGENDQDFLKWGEGLFLGHSVITIELDEFISQNLRFFFTSFYFQYFIFWFLDLLMVRVFGYSAFL